MTDRETIIRLNEENRDRLSETERRVVMLSALCLALVGSMILKWLMERP